VSNAEAMARSAPQLDFAAGFWRLADPKISLASMASILIGACAAAAAGPIQWSWLALTVFGIFAIEVAKNASGEIFDFDSGADLAVAKKDRSPFSGGKRVLVDGLLTRTQTLVISAGGYVVGVATGIIIAIWKEPLVFWIGVAGVFAAFFYQAPPLKFSYRGFGELMVALCYGPLICIGTYLVQRGEITAEPVRASIPLGLLIANFLWINEFPDFEADQKANKRTLVVRLGRRRATAVFVLIFACAFIVLAIAHPRIAVLWGDIAIVPAILAILQLWRAACQTPKLISAQANTLLAFLLYSIGAGAGFLLGN
jgi:1,4-dihydroxy-2-naphthoate polyprenyltransferase